MRIIRQLAIAATIGAAAAGAAAQNSNLFRSVRAPKIDKIISEAVLPSIDVVRSTYFVADSTFEQKYRAKGDTVFGREYSLCVMTAAGPVFSACAETPWDFDARYDKYRGNPAYKTLLNDHTLAPADGSGEFRPFAINEELWLKPVPAGALESPVLLGQFEPVTERKGLPTAVPAGKAVSGIVMWFTYNPESETVAGKPRVNVSFEEATLSFGKDEASTTFTPVNAPEAGELIGSIFLMPAVTSPGVLEFRLGAFIVPPSGLEEEWTVLSADMPQLGAGDGVLPSDAVVGVVEYEVDDTENTAADTDATEAVPVNPDEKAKTVSK